MKNPPLIPCVLAVVSLAASSCGTSAWNQPAFPLSHTLIVVQSPAVAQGSPVTPSPAAQIPVTPPPVVLPQTMSTPVEQEAISLPPLSATVYELPAGIGALPDFSQFPKLASFTTRDINVSARNYTDGFPGVPGRFEWFGIQYTGSFQARSTEPYAFRVEADDGAKLYVDGKLVVDNDGIHPPISKMGVVTLEAGVHTLRVDYYQGPHDLMALRVSWATPGQQETYFQVK